MDLKLLYQDNESGRKIGRFFYENFRDATVSRLWLNGQEYLNIQTNTGGRPLRWLNTPRAVGNALNNEMLCPILNMNGIVCGNQIDESLLRTYEVVLWGFKCLSLKVWGGTRSRENAKHLRESENPRVVDVARRVLYLSGLDLGKVVVAYTARRRFKVLVVEPSPELREKDLDALGKRIMELSQLDGHIIQRDIKLGADPEFMMFNSKNGRIISASEHFPKEGMIGCDNIRIPNRTQRPIAEIRPRPDVSPITLTANIKQALQLASQMAPYRNVRWVAGSQPGGGFSIGGHIHFGNIKINASLLRALDNFVGLPVFLIENPVSAARRRKKYGQLGDHREKEYGGFEYRTPGSWLVSQNITLAILCLAKIVVSRYPWLPYNYLNSIEAQDAFYHGRQEYFYPIFRRLWAHLEELDMFETYRKQLQVLYDMIENHTCWNETSDFRKSWMIPGGNRPLSKNNRGASSRSNRNEPSYSGIRNQDGSNAFLPSNYFLNPSRNTAIRAGGSGQRTRGTRSRNTAPGSGTTSNGGRIVGAHQVRRSFRVR